MFEIEVRGTGQLEAVGARLKAAGAGGLRRDLLRGIRTAAKPLISVAQAGAAQKLPQSGGLAARVAGSKFAVRTRLTGGGAGVRIVGTNGYRIDRMDQGQVRHPVYGRRAWVDQAVPAGWFTESLQSKSGPAVKPAIDRVVREVARKIEG